MIKQHVVKFTKKDGTERKMRFVVVGDLAPSERAQLGVPPASDRPPTTPSGSILVWDLDAQGYRTFNPATATEGWH